MHAHLVRDTFDARLTTRVNDHASGSFEGIAV
jgi:hypothetical protein